MRKSTIHQIHRFRLWDRTRRAATTAGEIKTAVTTREETAAVVGTAATAEEGTTATMGTAATMETAATVETVAIAARASKVFRKRAIIAAKKETATIAARAFKRGDTASFDKGEKYI